ncbi:MAG: hypothetical protein NZ853_09325 [Leptospiraceae bacterium]|nr:hypothetical protein [Leptospiraceae bacterium]MDW7975630.1 hypothetical protein [Leptospiraceae bacterium]
MGYSTKDFYYQLWKRKKPSKSYHRAYEAILTDGTKFELEYNFIKEIVKIEYFPSNEQKHYIILIQRGSILQERDFQTQRPVSLFSKITTYRNYFSYLYDEQVLKAIGGCYDIPTISLHPQASSDFKDLQFPKKKLFSKKKFIDFIKRYTAEKEEKQKNLKGLKKALYRMPGDLFDGFVIFVLFYFFLMGELTSFLFSFLSIFYSILSGFFDIYIRRRNPLLVKTLILLFPGILIFWFQYQLYEWGIQKPAYLYMDVLVLLFVQQTKFLFGG